MKKVKAFIIAVLLSLGFVSAPAFAATTSEGGYTITKYHIDINVNENNILDITEDISVNFSEKRHGIFRNFPVYNSVTREDGSTSKVRAKITDIAVSEQYTTSREGNNLELKIGDPDRTIIGAKNYRITNKYDLGRDPLKDKDEFYYNIIGTEWDTTISNITFRITMPKEFDKSKLGFATGTREKYSSDLVTYYVTDDEIEGAVFGRLNPHEALTVRVELPEGYFVGAGPEPSDALYLIYALPILFFLISFRLWARYGKDDKIFIKPEYEAPKGCNSLDVGFFYSGKANSTDVLSLIVYLANKGYIKIEEIEEKGILSKNKSFKFIKVKDYDGKDENERMFLKGLFASGNEVVKKDLYNKFYKTTNKIIQNRNRQEKIRQIFEKTGLMSAFAYITGTLAFIFAIAPGMIDYNEEEMMMIALIFPFYLFTMALAILCGVIKSRKNGSKRTIGMWICAVFLFVIGFVPVLLIAMPIIELHKIYMIGFIVDFIAYIGIFVCAFYMPKRTKYGLEMYAKAEGFRQFLDSVEKERIEKMVEENPNFFYDVLPYTYVFGISDKWIKKFEDINLQAPDWYSGSTASFNAVTFGSFMHSTMTSASSSMSSSSGGGSAGGGSGGGGGGSW